MSIKELQDVQAIFIQDKDWEEVSKIQYEMDSLSPSEQRQQFEPWFIIALDQYCLKLYDEYLSKLIEAIQNYKEKGE
jgi:hypothetical protein